MTASPHTEKPRRAFTAGRIVALVLIGLALLAVGYVRVATGEDTVSVPAGAKAGDLSLHSCDYTTEDGTFAADCGTLVVPENRTDPKSRLIAVPVTRIRSTSDHPAEPIFRMEGGPGLTNMTFPYASRYLENHDVVLVGYRGVDGSVRLDCPEVESALKHSTDLVADKFFRAYVDGFRACADRLTADGVDLTSYGLAQQTDDMEAARIALGYDRIDLVSESAGTRTALIYAWRHPTSIHRSVLIGVNPPGHFMWPAETTTEQIAKYAALCAKDTDCSGRTDDLAATMRKDVPGRWLFLPIKQGNVQAASFFALFETTKEMAPISAPMTLGSWLSAEEGDPSGFWFASIAADLIYPGSFVWGQYASAGRVDAKAAAEYFAGPRDRKSIGDAATAFIWGGGLLTDGWPAAPDENEYSKTRTSDVEMLLIGGDLDFSTPPQVTTRELMPYLPNGHQVVLPEFGHSTSFWSDQPEAGTKMISTYLATGTVDESGYEPQPVDFTPGVTQPAIAKLVAGAMVGLAVVALLSLLLMSRRVRKRGHFGRKAGATLRALYPVVLGLGGWFVGVLIVITTMPGTPLDSEPVAVLSMGLPIGLGIYFAWTNRDWSSSAKTTGFAAAMAGALVGAWLGFNATEGLFAVLMTILGAAAVGNLALVGLDIAWDRKARDRSTEPAAKKTFEARPSIG